MALSGTNPNGRHPVPVLAAVRGSSSSIVHLAVHSPQRLAEVQDEPTPGPEIDTTAPRQPTAPLKYHEPDSLGWFIRSLLLEMRKCVIAGGMGRGQVPGIASTDARIAEDSWPTQVDDRKGDVLAPGGPGPGTI